MTARMELASSDFAAASYTGGQEHSRIAPSGFEPLSPAPKASMLGHYTTGVSINHRPPLQKNSRRIPRTAPDCFRGFPSGSDAPDEDLSYRRPRE